MQSCLEPCGAVGVSGTLEQAARDAFLNRCPVQSIGLPSEGTGKGQEKPKKRLSGRAEPTQPTSPQTGSLRREIGW